MEVIQLPEGGGKTTQLVRFMLREGNEDVVYIAPTHVQASMALRMALDMKPGQVSKSRFLAANSENLRRNLKHGARVVIDELDTVLSMKLGIDGGFIEYAAFTPASARREYQDLRKRVTEAEYELNRAKEALMNYKSGVRYQLPPVMKVPDPEEQE